MPDNTPKGYASVQELADYMGMTFSTAQAAMAAYALVAAEERIDDVLGMSWLEAGPVTEVIYNPQTMYLRLKRAPITGITSVTVEGVAGCETWTLTADTQYFLHEASIGLVWSPLTRYAYKVTVVYTVDATVAPPAAVHMATLALAQHYMRLAPTFVDGADPNVVQRYVVGGELQVEFRKALTTGGGGLPQQVLDLLEPLSRGYAVI